MKNISSLKVIKFFAWFGVVLALNMLGKSYIHYQVLDSSLESIKILAPLDRDISSEIVLPLVAGHKDAESILKLVHSPHEKSKMLHNAWFQSVLNHRSEAFFQIILWVVVLVSFIAIAFSVGRHRCEL